MSREPHTGRHDLGTSTATTERGTQPAGRPTAMPSCVRCLVHASDDPPPLAGHTRSEHFDVDDLRVRKLAVVISEASVARSSRSTASSRHQRKRRGVDSRRHGNDPSRLSTCLWTESAQRTEPVGHQHSVAVSLLLARRRRVHARTLHRRTLRGHLRRSRVPRPVTAAAGRPRRQGRLTWFSRTAARASC